MDEKLVQEIDTAALSFFKAKEQGNKNDELKYRNIVWVLIYNHYSKRLTEANYFDELNRCVLSCFANWDGQNSFAHYVSKSVSIAFKNNTVPNYMRTKLKTVAIVEVGGDGEEYNIADAAGISVREEYNISESYTDALKILTAAVEVQNRIYLTKKTYNYYRLFYTESVALLSLYGIEYKDVSRLANKVMNTLSIPFAQHFKYSECTELAGLLAAEFKNLACFTYKQSDEDKSCLINKNTMLHSAVFLTYLNSHGQYVSIPGLSQQRKNYNSLRERLKISEWLGNG